MNPIKWLAAALRPAGDAFNLREIEAGKTTADELRVRMGPPGAQYANDDGSTTFEYNRQPQGTDCFMITVGRDQIVRRIEQVLTETNLARVKPGMDRDDVRRLLGNPGSLGEFPGMEEEVWDWRVAGVLPTEEAHFHVHFDRRSGLATRITRRIESRG